MNKKLFLMIAVILSVLLVTACGTLGQQPVINSALAADNGTSGVTRSLSVNGTGRVTLTPDIAYVTIGVQTEASDAADAVSENSTKTEAVVDALGSAGVEAKDIKTTNFSIYPQQKFDSQGQPTGEVTYIVNNSVFVTVRDLDSIGELLNSVVEAGANNIQGVQFDVEDKTEAYAEAQTMAVSNAQAQAENLAEAADVVLGEVITINTFGAAVPLPKYDGFGGGGFAVAEAAAVPISAGEMMVNVEVSMVFAIE